ncbi:hypothetical protein DXG01_002622 [Tephrocybe rancida]|nr:hypothetical protein DXG01_002622 [Tephrocybe rancida]
MGQRHQIFLIAKIIPHKLTEAKYRCIAAMHHQWCYGSLPLLATRRLLTLLKKPEHSQIVREELRVLNGKYGRWRVAPKTPTVPCPFSSFLLSVSFNMPDFSNAVLDSNMGSSQGDNNDGITIVDITDPENPSYCFSRRVPCRAPLTATQYIRAYYPAGETRDAAHEETILSTIAALDGESILTLQMLKEAWPQEYPSQPGDEAPTSVHNSSSTATPSSGISSLSDLALKPSIDHALETSNIQDIERLVWLPGRAEAIMSILKARNPFPDSAVPLLAQALNHLELNRNVDLSNFALSTAQILSLVSNLHDVQDLNISHNEYVAIDTVRALLESIPSLKRLVLLGSSVTDQALSSLLMNQKLFFNLEALIHPLFLDTTKKTTFPNAFAFLTNGTITAGGMSVASIPFFTPSLIVQALSDYLTERLKDPSPDISPQAAFSSTVRTGDETWAARTIPFVASGLFDGVVKKEGWFLALDCGYPYIPKCKYAFVEPTSGNAMLGAEVSEDADGGFDGFKQVLDLKGFLAEMKAQGRPSAPDPAVNALCALLDHMKAELMDVTAVSDFFQPIPMLQAIQAHNFGERWF